MSPAKILHTLSPVIQPDIAMQELLNSNISKDPQPHHRHISPLLCTRNGPIVHELNFKPTVQVKIWNFGTCFFNQNQWLCATSLEIMACTITPSPSFQKSTFHPDKLSKLQEMERFCGAVLQQLCSEMLLLPQRICCG